MNLMSFKDQSRSWNLRLLTLSCSLEGENERHKKDELTFSLNFATICLLGGVSLLLPDCQVLIAEYFNSAEVSEIR